MASIVILTLVIDGLTSIILILLSTINLQVLGFPGGSVLKNLPANAGDADSIFRLGKSARKENGSPLQYSCLGSPTEGEVWWATVHGVTKKSRILLSDQTTVTTSSVPGSAGFHFLRPILRIVAAYAWLQSGHHIVNFSTWWEFQ